MPSKIGIAAKIGAILFVLWGILHIWVPYGGFSDFEENGHMFGMFTGGEMVAKTDIILPSDMKTAFTINNLFFNFVSDVGGFGVLSLFIAYMIWTGSCPWIAYLIGLICLGIADVAFVRYMVASGTIERTFPVVVGPLLWVLAVLITPFGLPMKF